MVGVHKNETEITRSWKKKGDDLFRVRRLLISVHDRLRLLRACCESRKINII
jgi:hypothetical protein